MVGFTAVRVGVCVPGGQVLPPFAWPPLVSHEAIWGGETIRSGSARRTAPALPVPPRFMSARLAVDAKSAWGTAGVVATARPATGVGSP